MHQREIERKARRAEFLAKEATEIPAMEQDLQDAGYQLLRMYRTRYYYSIPEGYHLEIPKAETTRKDAIRFMHSHLTLSRRNTALEAELESIYALAREYAHDGDLQNHSDLADCLEKIAARLGKLLNK